MFIRVIGVILLVVFVCVFPIDVDGESVGEPLMGGPCEYKKYEGVAKIISINQRSYPNSDLYEVKFLFYPAQEIKEPFAQMEGRELLLLTRRGSYPGATFLEENGIEVGRVFDCILNVIVKGTCTPVIFEFPSIAD
jgi:hypothetical protein